MEEYSFKNHSFKMIDEEIGIDHIENFSPVRTPEDLRNKQQLKDDHILYVHRYGNGCFEYAIRKGDELNGEYQLTYPDGSLKHHCYYNWGKLHGPSLFYGEKGNILTQSWFVKGKQMGKSHWFYASGKPSSTQRYLDDKWHGKQEYWYEDGTLKTLMEYEYGELNGYVKLFFPNGKVKRELVFDKGVFVSETQ